MILLYSIHSIFGEYLINIVINLYSIINIIITISSSSNSRRRKLRAVMVNAITSNRKMINYTPLVGIAYMWANVRGTPFLPRSLYPQWTITDCSRWRWSVSGRRAWERPGEGWVTV